MATPKPAKTIKLQVLVRVNFEGAYDVTGWGSSLGHASLDEIQGHLEDNYNLEGAFEQYMVELEVPAYTAYAPPVRFKVKVA